MAIHVQAIKRLTPEDYKLIETEHARLQGSIANLRSTCSFLEYSRSCMGCTREKLSTCRGRLVSFSYNIMDFSADHFSHEEAIMLRQADETDEYDDYFSHRRAHQQMLRKLDRIVKECASLDAEGNTAGAYRRLYTGMSEEFQKHERLFDDPFIQSAKGKDHPLNADEFGGSPS